MVRPALPPGLRAQLPLHHEVLAMVWFLSRPFLLAFVMSRSSPAPTTARPPCPTWTRAPWTGPRVKLVPGYAPACSAQQGGAGRARPAPVAAGMGDTGASEWLRQPLQQQHFPSGLDSGEHGPAPRRSVEVVDGEKALACCSL